MIKKQLIYFPILSILVGCSTYMEKVVYKPAIKTYEEWKKPNATLLDVKKGLLECGLPYINRRFEIYENILKIDRHDELLYMNQVILENKCLERSGFIYLGNYNTSKLCSTPKYANLLACQPNTIIPVPSVERRLNSWHCKIETDYEYCLKHALNPPVCKPDDFKHPPPECIPPGQEYIPQQNKQSTHKNQGDIYQPMPEYPDKTMQLQQDMQNQSNEDITRMLGNSVNGKRR